MTQEELIEHWQKKMAEGFDGYPPYLKPIPQHMRDAVILYVERGIAPGSFLYSVLSNDFKGACQRADDINKHHLIEWAAFIVNFTPSDCQGSVEKVGAWIRNGGLLGKGEK